MAFSRFNDATDFNEKGARSLPDQPTISADALKRKFDEDARDVVAPKVNIIVGELEATSAAADLGAVAPAGRGTGTKVQAILNKLSEDLKVVEDTKSTIALSNVMTSGVRIATVVIDGNPTDLKAPQGGTGGGIWGTIGGTLSDQTDLQDALDAKADSSSLAGVATSGLYSDLSGTPSLATVATSGSYSDLSNKPTIPAVDQTYNSASTNAQSGTAVAGAIATKSAVAWSQTITTGQKIATVTIDGTPTDVYAPTGGGGGGGGAVDSVNGQTGTVVLDVDDINDVTIASIADQDTLVYNGTTHTWGNEPLADVALSGSYNDLSNTPSLATVATTGSYSDLSGTPTIPAAQIQSDWTQADNTKKDYIKNKPTIPTNLNSLSDVTVSSPSSDQVLKYNGSGWVNGAAPASGHTMIDTVADIEALTDGDDDYVVNGYAIKQWSNTDDIQLLVAVSADDDGIGTWEDDDTWETSGVRTGWIQHASLHGIMSDDDVLVEPVFKVPSGKNNAVSAYAMRVDDAITGSLGGVALKFNAPITANGYAGIRIRHLRTNTIILTP